jgi:broad specificity phosphatase PhoE
VVEIVSVVGRSTDTLTVGVAGSAAANAAGRGLEGTTATTWLTGDLIECRATAAIIVSGANASVPVTVPAAAHTMNYSLYGGL